MVQSRCRRKESDKKKNVLCRGSFQFHHVFCHVSIAETGAWSLRPSRGYSYSSLAPDDFTQNARWMASLITCLIFFAAHHSVINKWAAQPTHVYVCTLEDGNITPLLVLTVHVCVCVTWNSESDQFCLSFASQTDVGHMSKLGPGQRQAARWGLDWPWPLWEIKVSG